MTWVDNARILAILAVVILHAAPPVFTQNAIGSEYWWIATLYHAATRWCVPVLVMLSGILLLDPAKQEPITVFYRKRMARILLPTVFWSIFFLLWTAAKSTWQGNPVPASELVDNLLTGKPYFHLWFLYMIAGLYVLTPFMRHLLAVLSLREQQALLAWLFFLAAANSAFSAWHPDGQPELFLNWSLYFLPYFIAGPVLRDTTRQWHRNSLLTVMMTSTAAIAIGLYLTSAGSHNNLGYYFDGSLSITVIPLSLAALLWLKTLQQPLLGSRHNATVARLTFGVYLMHPAVMEVLAYLGLRTTAVHPALAIPLVSLVVFAATLIAAWMLSRLPLLHKVI